LFVGIGEMASRAVWVGGSGLEEEEEEGDDGIENSEESVEYDDEPDDEEDEGGLLSLPLTPAPLLSTGSGLRILSEEEMGRMGAPVPTSTAPALSVSISEPSIAPTRAGLRRGTTAATFICVDPEAFKSQLAKEEQRAGEQPPAPVATHGRHRRSSRVGLRAQASGARTTFICLDPEALEKQLQEVGKATPVAPAAPRQASFVLAPPRRVVDKPQPMPVQVTHEVMTAVIENVELPVLTGFVGKFGMAPPAMRATPVHTSVAPSASRKTSPVLQELIQTEKDYISRLELIESVFLKEIRERQLLTHYEVVSLFSNIEDLLPINRSLLVDLLKLQEAPDSISVGELFQNHANKFRAYAAYCTNQPNIHELLQQYKVDNPEFANFLKKAFRNPACRKQSLESFLVMPLQRLCRYPLLLKELVSQEQKTLVSVQPIRAVRMTYWEGIEQVEYGEQ
jgi:hypothetical protein